MFFFYAKVHKNFEISKFYSLKVNKLQHNIHNLLIITWGVLIIILSNIVFNVIKFRRFKTLHFGLESTYFTQ